MQLTGILAFALNENGVQVDGFCCSAACHPHMIEKLEDKTMNLKYVFAAATLLLLSGQALAFHCPWI